MCRRKPATSAPEKAVAAPQQAHSAAQLAGGEWRLECLAPRDCRRQFYLKKPCQAALELLNYIKGETFSSRKIQETYYTISFLNHEKMRFAVQLEFILTCLQRGSMEDAYQAALWYSVDHFLLSLPTRLISVMQERGFDSDPLTELDSSGTYMQPEIPVDGIRMSIDYSKDNAALEAGANSVLQCDSNTSVAFDKVVEGDGSQQKESIDVDDNVKRKLLLPVLSHKSLPPWVLPIKLPSSHENLEDVLYMHRKLHNNHYKSALKYLRVALYSTPPVVEALHPLIQMLLLGDQVQEALDELETLSHTLDTVLQLRLKASLLEHFDSGSYVKLCTCFEDILKKDPTCSDSLARLILMHRRGDYDTQSLVEMIALHLDASYGICDTWQELASCFLRLSQCEEDRVSTCGSDQYSQGYLDESNKIPELFTNGESGKAWRLRSRWWLNRHFHDRIRTSDIASGDLKLLTYKAAAASHIYGRHFKYVLKATESIEKENDMELYSFLQTHILNSVGFYSVKRNT
ncbi:hypothetical protein DH2020_033615 [Rehmannia glutinosa]|uniref:Uncharacterized protein n=1 Tax=Rehmannia glutinosa TaxID=99300 RepID=A0ABR0VDP7_REHGL